MTSLEKLEAAREQIRRATYLDADDHVMLGFHLGFAAAHIDSVIETMRADELEEGSEEEEAHA